MAKYFKSKAALAAFTSKCKKENAVRILDVGAGVNSLHTKAIRAAGLYVETNDILESDHQGDYLSIGDIGTFDGIWCSHVLEHQRNPGLFLDRIHKDLREGGILAITVPPRKDLIVGGHVSLWNAGLLLYHLILARFDCRNAMVATYGYNISVILNKHTISDLPELKHDGGDINTLAKYFPTGIEAKERFNGFIVNHNWKPTPDEAPWFDSIIK